MNLGQWIGLFALCLSLYILWQIRQVLLLVFAAVVLATALNRLAQRLQRSGMARAGAVLLSILMLITIFIGFFFLIVPPFASQFQQLTELLPKGINRLNTWVDLLRTRIPSQLEQYLPDVDSIVQQLQPVANLLIERTVNFFSGSLGVALNLLLVLILTLMLLADPKQYRQAFIRLFPSFYRRRVDGILDACEVALGGWLVGILFNMMVIAVFSCVGLLVLQVPLALAHGILAGLLTFIPNIGPALSVIPPMTVALLDAPWKSLAVLILYIVVQQLESNILTPYVMAQQVSLLPAVTLLAQIFFATFFGFLGLLLALPLTVVGQVWLQEVLIKDVLDQWKRQPQWYVEPVVVGELAAAEDPDTVEAQPESDRFTKNTQSKINDSPTDRDSEGNQSEPSDS